MDKNYSKTLTALKAERALCILTNRVDKIADVKSWASEAKNFEAMIMHNYETTIWKAT
jgi:hypothetical protein